MRRDDTGFYGERDLSMRDIGITRQTAAILVTSFILLLIVAFTI